MLPFTVPAVPAALSSAPLWLVWRYVHIEGQPKPRKVPYYANGAPRGQKRQGEELVDATPDEDRAALVTMDAAVAAIRGAQGRYSGLGMAILPGCGIVALDFDDCVAGDIINPEVEAICAGTYYEISPSGTGLRAFFTGSLQSSKDAGAKRGPFPIEVFGTSGYVTVTGNIAPTCSLFGWDEGVIPVTDAVRAELARRGWSTGDSLAHLFGDDDEADLAGLITLEPKAGLTTLQVAEMLALLPNDLDYDTWVKVGQSVHHETDGSDEGFALWHDWSKNSPKYTTEKYCRDRWVSFGRYTGRPATMGWIERQTRDQRENHEKRQRYERCADWKQKITAADDEFALRETICMEITKDKLLEAFERESLAVTLKDKLKALGTPQSISVCRKLVTPAPAARTDLAEVDMPEWCQRWVYVTDDDQFFRIDSEEWLSAQGFNAKFDRFMPTNEQGLPIQPASAGALRMYGLPTVTRGMYAPGKESNFPYYGVQCVNTYRPSSVPKAATGFTPEGEKFVEQWKFHLRDVICGGRVEVYEHLVSWLAYAVQNPGKKIRHAPLIKGIEGDGKSFIGELLSAVMGVANVRSVSPKVIGTDFNGYVEGSCVCVLEELKMTGHNRHDVHNALKPAITNNRIGVHRKGKDEYNIENVTNYIAFTNHADALPLDDTDRRYFVIFTPFAVLEELTARLVKGGYAPGDYFAAMDRSIKQRPAEMRLWLLRHAVSPSFDPHARAPLTAEKASMIAMGKSDEEEAARDVIERGAYGVCRDVLTSKCLTDAVALEDGSLALQTTTVSRLLGRLGYTRFARKVRWDGAVHIIWHRASVPSDPEALKVALDKTKPETVIPDNLFD